MSCLAVIGRRVALARGTLQSQSGARMVAWRGATCHPPDWGESHPPPARGRRFYKWGVAASTPPNNWLAQNNG
ncbi:hypothetical protein SAMN05446635_5146 [Burkholderia sp. OK233]|nr:hypothetical protein SAMN05446635_5146 [Burkholderia sp. OK233]